MILSGVLSFIFGPLGWLYAAPMREAIPAIVVSSLLNGVIWSLVPDSLIPLALSVGNAFFGLFGAAYAMRHNQNGRRTPIFTEEKPQLPGR